MNKKVIRIAISPFVGIFVIALMMAGCIPLFPLTFLALFYVACLVVSYPIVKLLNHVGENINIEMYLSCPVTITKSIFANLFIYLLFPIWLPFYAMFKYIKTGKLIS